MTPQPETRSDDSYLVWDALTDAWNQTEAPRLEQAQAVLSELDIRQVGWQLPVEEGNEEHERLHSWGHTPREFIHANSAACRPVFTLGAVSPEGETR